MKHKSQKFNAVAARSQSTMLTLAAVSLIGPAAFHYLAGPGGRVKEDGLSLGDLARPAGYLCSRIAVLTEDSQAVLRRDAWRAGGAHDEEPWSVRKALLVLAGATALIAWMSEILVGSVEPAAEAFGMSRVFVGVIVVAIVGNAAEHSTAVMMAMRNRMELSLGIAIGSSVQIALFVAPVLVLASYFIGPRHMDLVFSPAEVMAIVLAVGITWQISADGESNWLEGVQLLAVYLILALVFFFLPETTVGQSSQPAH